MPVLTLPDIGLILYSHYLLSVHISQPLPDAVMLDAYTCIRSRCYIGKCAAATLWWKEALLQGIQGTYAQTH